ELVGRAPRDGSRGACRARTRARIQAAERALSLDLLGHAEGPDPLVTLARDAQTLLDRARAEARRHGHEEVTVEHLVVSALSTLDVAPVEKFSERAASIAREHGHVNVLVDHGLVAMIDLDEGFREALRVLGHEPKSVRRKLVQRFTRQLRSHRLSPLGQLVEFAATRTYLAPGVHEMTLEPIVVDLLRHASVRTAIEAVDVNRYDLLYAYVH